MFLVSSLFFFVWFPCGRLSWLHVSFWAHVNIVHHIISLQQNWLRWYRHVLWKEDTDWVKKCMEYEVEGSRPRGRPKRIWREVMQKDCQARNLNREDAMDRGRWKKLIKTGWWSAWWVGECFFWYRLTRVVPDKGPYNDCCCVGEYCAASCPSPLMVADLAFS